MPGNEVKIRAARPGDLAEMVDMLKLLFTIEEEFRIDYARQERGLSLLLGSPARWCWPPRRTARWWAWSPGSW